MTTMACHKIHIFAEDEVTCKAPIFDPDSQPPEQFNKYGQAAEIVKLHIRMFFVTDDFTDMMPSYHNLVKSVSESEDPPLDVSRSKGTREDSSMPSQREKILISDKMKEYTMTATRSSPRPIDAAYKSIAMGEQNHGVKTCLIMFDEAHKGDVSKLYNETDDDNVSSKRATEMTIMMHNTDTLKSAYSLRATVNVDDDENEAPPEEHDDHDQAKLVDNMEEDVKKTAPLDALFPTMQVPSTNKKQ